MSDKKQITFTRSVEVKDHNGSVEFSAEMGDCVELVTSSAARWVGRRMAVYGKLDLSEDAPDTKKTESEVSADIKKAHGLLEKAKARYQAAYTAHQKKADDKTVKELGLASKHQDNKLQEYDAIVAASKED